MEMWPPYSLFWSLNEDGSLQARPFLLLCLLRLLLPFLRRHPAAAPRARNPPLATFARRLRRGGGGGGGR